jgi:glycosyltransferase involved in cell wall biosynthesis
VTVSLLITTFSRPEALNLVLESVMRQSRAPDEVVVCDDGSSVETTMLVRLWERKLPIRYAWQPDRGFRAARSRNLGVFNSSTNYLVWLDGDCLLPPRFLENHLQLARPGYLVAGGRHLLSNTETQKLLAGVLRVENAFSHWKFRSVSMGVLRDLRPEIWEAVRTCNVGLYRHDLEAIGGFDEAYIGWGREDSDFVVRLIHQGMKVRSGRLAACVAHLHHSERSRDQLSENDARFISCLNNPAHVHPKSSILVES